MATGWVLNKVSEAIAPTVSSTVATAGGFAGDVVAAVGNGINGVGQSINSSISYYGNNTKDLANGLKNWTGAPGSRAQSASNPLGLSDTKGAGKRAIAGSGAPKTAKSWSPTPSPKALPASKPAAPKPKAAPPMKGGMALPKPRPSSINTAKSNAMSKSGNLPSANSAKSTPSSAGSKTSSKAPSYNIPPTSAKKTPVASKSSPITRTRVVGSTDEARNPLGL